MKTLFAKVCSLILTLGLFLGSCSDPINLGAAVGEFEEVSKRQHFPGNWNFTSTLNANSAVVQMATVNIELDPNSENGLRLYNFANLGERTFTLAFLSEDGSGLEIENQSVEGIVVSGAGTFMTSQGRVDMNITLNKNAYNVSLIKQ